MGIEIDVTANAKGFVQAAGEAASSLNGIADALDFIAQNADFSDAQLQTLFERTASQARQAGEAAQQSYNRGTVAVNEFDRALQQTNRELRETQVALDQVTRTPAALDESLGRVDQTATRMGSDVEKSGEKIQESGKLGEAALMNLGFSSMQAGTLFTNGLSGMAEQAGTFAAFMGPSLAGIEGSFGALAWPITIAGVALAAIGGIMNTTSADASTLTTQTQDLLSTFLGTQVGGDQLDQGLRKWAKSADDFGGLSLTDLRKNLENTKVSFGGVASAIATQSLPEMQKQKKIVEDNIEALKTQAEVLRASNSGEGARADALGREADALGHVKTALDTNIDANKLAAEAEKAVAEQNHMTVDQYKAYETALADAQQAQKTFSDSLHSDLAQAGQDTSDFTTNGVLDIQKYIDHLNGITQSIIQESQNLTSVAPYLTQAGLTYVESLGAQAAPLLAKAASLSPSDPQFQALMQSWDDAGNASGKTFGSGLQGGMPGSVNGPSVKITGDDYEYQQVLQRIKNNPPTIAIPVTAAPLLGGKRVF